jgi:SAM-dependent methyltransferase
MNDLIISAIDSGVLSARNISFDNIRRIASRDCDLWNQLGRGRAILDTPEELDQYLYSYGPMTRAQWHTLLGKLSLIPEPTEIIDYGCGQGLATALMFDCFGAEFIRSVRKVTLIEPSLVALERAAAIVACYSANRFQIETINKTLGELDAVELLGSTGVLTNHIFSNVLDIDGYDHFRLLEKLFQRKGRHCILAVSHDRNFEGGSSRVLDLEKAICDPQYHRWFAVQHTDVWQFECGNRKPAIAWVLEVEVIDGPF